MAGAAAGRAVPCPDPGGDEAFPGYRPYGGAFEDVVPHLTVGDRPSGGIAELRAAEAEVLPLLPVSTRVSRMWLMTGGAEPGSWRTVAEFPLAG